MTTLSSANNSLFLTIGGEGGGSGGTSIIVEDNLTSHSINNALSANQGRVLDELLKAHMGTVATELTYGHVKIDGDTIKVNDKGQIYVDGIADNPSDSKLTKYEYVLSPTVEGQVEFDIPLASYKPEFFVDMLFSNTTKRPTSEYTILAKDVNDVSKGFKLVLSTPSRLSTMLNLVLMCGTTNGIDVVGLSKIEYFLNPNIGNPTEIDIPFIEYDPDIYIDLMFRNSTKIPPNEYSIVPKNTSNLKLGYKVVLTKAPSNPTSTFINMVFITSSLSGGAGYNISRFYEGSVPPSDTKLFWYNTG